MNAKKTIRFDNFTLWCIHDESDLDHVAVALGNGEVDGVFLGKGQGFVGKNLDFLPQLQELRILAIDDLAGIDVSAISHCENLVFLSLGLSEGRCDLSALRRLEHLRLAITEEKQIPNSEFPFMKELLLWNFRGNDLKFLQNFPMLFELNIVGARNLYSLDGLELLRNLHNLMLYSCPKLVNINSLSNVITIKKLELENVKSLVNYDVIGELLMLTRLLIKNGGEMESLNFLRSLKNLESLVVRKTKVRKNGLRPLLQLPSLSHFYLDEKPEYKSDLLELRKAAASRVTLKNS